MGDRPTSLRIAAIVPVFERPTLVIEALESIAAQRRPADRIVVVDDGSSDETPEHVRQWIERHPELPAELLVEPNRGAAAARNRGAEAARHCDLLAFLDSDDLWLEDYLEVTERALAERPEAVAVTCDKRVHDATTGRSWVADLRWVGKHATRRMFWHGAAGTSNTVIRASVFFTVGGFAPDVLTGHDLHLMLRVSLHGPWLHVPGPRAVYRERQGDATGETEALRHRYADRRLRRAEYLSRFVFEDGGREAMSAWVWRRRLGRAWFLAGRQLFTLDRHDDAARALRTAATLWPLNPRYALSYLRARVAAGRRAVESNA